MKTKSILSSDSTPISLDISGSGDTALIFIHGWLGNKQWWSGQVSSFEKDYLVALMDLAGHGDSGKSRVNYTLKLYADDIVAAAKSLPVKEVILVGHSMSGAYVLEAAPHIPNLKALIVVDTLKDLDQTFTPEQIESMLDLYRDNFEMVVDKILPGYLFVDSTPSDIKSKIQAEFLSQSKIARAAIEPLYRMDLKTAARSVNIPVRAINSDNGPTNKEANQKYLSDYDFKVIKGTGHYPMLENVEAFNSALKEILVSFEK